jgi:flagellar basal body L-ring protein FlgH
MMIRTREIGRRVWPLVIGAALFGLPAGCFVSPEPAPAQAQATPQESLDQSVKKQVRERPPIRTTTNTYEGSLWRGTSSWGNLMRDHRARFSGDLLTVREMAKIVNVPDVVSEPGKTPGVPGAAGAAGAPAPAEAKTTEEKITDPVLRFLEEQRRLREEIDKERGEILRSIDLVEVQVLRVLPNGNMLVRGTHPPIFRDNNRVKYLFSINGIVRPSDVDDNNTVTSTKLSKAEYRLARLVKRPDFQMGSVARAAGAPREGALIDRFTDFLTTPSAGTAGTAR